MSKHQDLQISVVVISRIRVNIVINILWRMEVELVTGSLVLHDR